MNRKDPPTIIGQLFGVLVCVILAIVLIILSAKGIMELWQWAF